MDPTLLESTQNLEAATDDAEAAQNARIEAWALSFNCHQVGHIISFDGDSQTAKCQVGIRRIFRGDKGPVDLPPLVDCPVYGPAGGGFALTFPIAAGDECLLAFADRAIDFWWQNGGVQLPAEYRLHDLSDAIAFVGLPSLRGARKMSGGVSGSAAELRALDGSSSISLGQDGSITVTSKPGKGISLGAGAGGNVKVTGGAGGFVCLNTDGPLPPMVSPTTGAPGPSPSNAVLTANCICPLTGAPHLGGSLTVLAGP